MTDRASSPINTQELDRFASLMGKPRDIKNGKAISPVKVEGQIKFGKVVPSYRKERKWNLQE